MNLYDFTKPFPCPGCGRELPIKVAKTGMAPGSNYVHCNGCSFHLTMPSHTKTPPRYPPASQPAQEGRCPECPTRRPVHRECQRRMCKQCCIALGGCKAPKHQAQHLSLRQQQKQRSHIPPAAPPTPPPTQLPVEGFTSMQHILDSVPHPTQTLPPLHPDDIHALQNIRNADPVLSFFANEDQRRQGERLDAERGRLIAQQEERDFQAGVAASLGLPATVPVMPPASTPHQSPPLPSLSNSTPRTSPLTTSTLRDIPYRPPNITHHMNTDWMRPFEDRSKDTPKRRKRDANQRFRLVFWGWDDKPPVIHAINDCPDWPTWCLSDAPDVKHLLALEAEPLQFYDFGHLQWISCIHSYPHDLKKDGYLFLRRPSVTCLDFNTHVEHATDKMPHLFLNMPGERSAIKKHLQHRKAKPTSSFIEQGNADSDDEVEFVEPGVRKRQRSESPTDVTSSSQPRRPRLRSVSSEISEDPTSTSPSSYPSSPVSSRLMPTLNDKSYGALVYVPESKKKWPDGMYTVDMAKAFLEVESANFKKLRLKLPERLFRVFGKDIALTTWHDQRRHWGNATERQREEGVQGRRNAVGLWSAFKAKVPRN